ncbi:MAG: pyruvate formate lyase family protein [Planctomycetota bacterium]
MNGNAQQEPAAPYFQPPQSGPRCSTPRSARLRQRRFDMRSLERKEPAEYTALAEAAKQILLAAEAEDLSLARAKALAHVVEHCPMTLEKDAFLIGGEEPFLFNALRAAQDADAYQRSLPGACFDESMKAMQAGRLFTGPCFEGHITPGLEYLLGQGTEGLRWRLEEQRSRWLDTHPEDLARRRWYDAALLSCENLERYAERLRQAALERAAATGDPEWAAELRAAAATLARVPRHPAATLHEALQSFWLAYILVTIEMGGCTPGGGLGLGRPDQYLYPYYRRDLEAGRLTRVQALELIEGWLLNFQHCDYYTWHAVYTVGSQASLGGVTSTGADASNDLTELILEASLRIHMPTPYLSLRLHKDAPERYWQAAANFVIGGLGFSIVNDEVLIPAFLRHGRSLGDARDYICSCCYEFTIPGREAFHPNGTFLNLPAILDLALHEGRLPLAGASLGLSTPPPASFRHGDDLMSAFDRQLAFVVDKAVACVNGADRLRVAGRRFPLMSLFIEDCIAAGEDVCAGGARYNLTGMIVAGVPNVVNSLAAIRHCVFETGRLTLDEVLAALHDNFAGHERTRQELLRAPKWGNGDAVTGGIARAVTERIYAHLSVHTNARGGRWQAALYSFVANQSLGEAVGATPDGRRKGEILTRNLNPAWGTDHEGPTAVLQSLAYIDFTQFPDGGTLDLRFDPTPFLAEQGRAAFIAFLKGFVALKVMQMQITMVDTETLQDARRHPEKWPNLMVKVAGYSARFVDLSEVEKDEIIGRSLQRVGA